MLKKGSKSTLCAAGAIKGITQASIHSLLLGAASSLFKVLNVTVSYCLGVKKSITPPVNTAHSVHRALDHVWVLNGVCGVLAAMHSLQRCLVWQTKQNWVLSAGCGLDSHKAPSGSAPKESLCIIV